MENIKILLYKMMLLKLHKQIIGIMIPAFLLVPSLAHAHAPFETGVMPFATLTIIILLVIVIILWVKYLLLKKNIERLTKIIFSILIAVGLFFVLPFAWVMLCFLYQSILFGVENVAVESKKISLAEAIKKGELNQVQTLLSQGVNLEAKDYYGKTVLITAIEYNHPTIVQTLLDKGANVNTKDKEKKTPLMIALDASRSSMVPVLIDKGADINAKDKEGKTVLMYAAIKGDLNAVQLLLDKGVNINAKSNEGDTALMWAALTGKTNVVQVLLTKGADTSIRNKLGWTALSYAKSHVFGGNKEIVRLLVQAGAKE